MSEAATTESILRIAELASDESKDRLSQAVGDEIGHLQGSVPGLVLGLADAAWFGEARRSLLGLSLLGSSLEEDEEELEWASLIANLKAGSLYKGAVSKSLDRMTKPVTLEAGRRALVAIVEALQGEDRDAVLARMTGFASETDWSPDRSEFDAHAACISAFEEIIARFDPSSSVALAEHEAGRLVRALVESGASLSSIEPILGQLDPSKLKDFDLELKRLEEMSPLEELRSVHARLELRSAFPDRHLRRVPSTEVGAIIFRSSKASETDTAINPMRGRVFETFMQSSPSAAQVNAFVRSSRATWATPFVEWAKSNTPNQVTKVWSYLVSRGHDPGALELSRHSPVDPTAAAAALVPMAGSPDEHVRQRAVGMLKGFPTYRSDSKKVAAEVAVALTKHGAGDSKSAAIRILGDFKPTLAANQKKVLESLPKSRFTRLADKAYGATLGIFKS